MEKAAISQAQRNSFLTMLENYSAVQQHMSKVDRDRRHLARCHAIGRAVEDRRVETVVDDLLAARATVAKLEDDLCKNGFVVDEDGIVSIADKATRLDAEIDADIAAEVPERDISLEIMQARVKIVAAQTVEEAEAVVNALLK